LQARYSDNPRVTIDDSPHEFFFWEFGNVMIAAHHGHLVKPTGMAAVMAESEAAMWGRTKYRYAFLGHEHRSRKGLGTADEGGGAKWEVMETVAPRDSWAASMGHHAMRSMTAIEFDRESGEKARYTEYV
jgi:hypothetical protein